MSKLTGYDMERIKSHDCGKRTKSLVSSHDAEVLVIIETKLNKHNCNSQQVKAIFENYTLFHSCIASKTPYN